MEARALLAVGILATVGALVWLFGPLGLLGSGLALTVAALFLIDVKERARGEAVADPAWTDRGRPVRR
jgi:hypothetical protein